MIAPRTSALILITWIATASSTSADEVWQTLPTPPPMPPAAESGTVPVNDIEMYYAVYGNGEPLVMLHGGLAHSDVWGYQIPELAAHFKVIVADSRGHGRSTRSTQPYSYGLMASDVIALMDYLEIDKASLVGWSDGGIIGLDIAMNHPERLTRLFAFGANYNTRGLREDAATSVTFRKYVEICGKDYARLSRTPSEYNAFVRQLSEMSYTQPDYPPERLTKISVPTVIADGEYDEGIKREHTERLAELIPGAKLVILPGVSHFAMWQRPDEFNEAVLDFLLAK